MAAFTLPAPGTKFGACAESCKHTDCAALRRMAESNCVICFQPIGYDWRYYEHRLGLAHARCVESHQGDS